MAALRPTMYCGTGTCSIHQLARFCSWSTATRLLRKQSEFSVCSRLTKRYRSRIWQIALSQKKTDEAVQSDVCFLALKKRPTHDFKQALDALQAYAIEGDEEVILHVNVKDKARSDSIRGNVLLRHPFGETKTILVFAEGDLAKEAVNAGADIVGGKEIIPQVENQELNFDYCLSSLEFLDNLNHLPRVLREKMPHPRKGTATNDLQMAVATFKQGYSYKCDRNAILKLNLGMLSFKSQQILENLSVLLESVLSHHVDKKSDFANSAFLTSTLGPGYRLNAEEVLRLK